MATPDSYRLRFGSGVAHAESTMPARIQAHNTMQMFNGLNDPLFYEFIRGSVGGMTARQALKTACVLRCVDLISSTIAALPFYILRKGKDGTKEHATDHPLYDLLLNEPNSYQDAFEFKRLMELRRLCHGNAYAYIVRSGTRVAQLIPLDPTRVTPRQRPDWTMEYVWEREDGGKVTLAGSDVLHLRDLSMDGVAGEARTTLAAEAIGVAQAAERAQARLFANGMMVGGALTHPGKLGPETIQRLRKSIEDRHAGIDNIAKWLVLEEGMKAERFSMTGQEAQTVEARNHQIEDVARAFGVPRPLLMMDDTSWGSGIEQLAILFVRFGLAPSMTSWEKAVRRVCLTREEKRTLEPDIDERELLRGSMKDQAEFLAKALGSGGHPAWMEQNEARDFTGLGMHPDGSGLSKGAAQQGGTQNAAA